MGGHPYWYFVPYEDDLQAALDKLRQRELEAKRFFPAVFSPFGPDITSMSPELKKLLAGMGGDRCKTIAEAQEAAGETGTRSILDIEKIGKQPDYGVAAPFPDELVEAAFGTAQPTKQQAEDDLGDLLEHVERGQCSYVILYERGKPAEILFVGYSYD
jgi:hypothetical protein